MKRKFHCISVMEMFKERNRSEKEHNDQKDHTADHSLWLRSLECLWMKKKMKLFLKNYLNQFHLFVI